MLDYGFRLKIHKTVYNNYNFIQTKVRYKSKERLSKKYWNYNDFKLDNNIVRAKTNIFNIVSYNKFKYFYTQTISSVFARSDLKRLISRFSYFTCNLRKKFPDREFYYLIIPEYHKDKRNWHIHGLLSSGYEVCCYINNNGFLSLSYFDKIGINSASVIKNYEACCKYITKYITKDIALDIKKGEKMYYCSQKMLRENLVNDIIVTQIAPIHFDFKNEYVYKTSVEEKKYYKFITDIDNMQHLNYYNIK